MKSFMYLVELVLISILLISYLYYLRVPLDIQKIISQFEKKYLLDTLALSLRNIYMVNFEDIFKIAYLLYSEKLNSFSQNLERLEFIYLEKDISGCIMFFYPFPNFEKDSYYTIEKVYFFIYNIDGKLCRNFTVSKDWKIIKINNIPTNNSFSLYLKDFLNLSKLDPFSIFVFDDYGNEVKINAISYDNNYLNISINYISLIHRLPLYILVRIKDTENIKNLEYLSNRYSIFQILNAEEVSFSIFDSNWLTIYLNDTCSLEKTLVIYYSILPLDKFSSKVSPNVIKENCNGNYNVFYFKDNLFEKYSSLKLLNLKVEKELGRVGYENNLYFINGLNLAILKIYGS